MSAIDSKQLFTTESQLKPCLKSLGFSKMKYDFHKLIRIWNPDILMYNSASKEFDSTYKVNIIVYNDGSCKYGPPGIFTSTCQVMSIYENN